MNHKLVKTLLVLLLLSGAAEAQLIWHEGEVTLASGVILRGEVCYQPQADALLFRTGDFRAADTWKTYTADQLRRFRYTDQVNSRRQQFAIYEVLQSTGETRAILFEEFLPGAFVPLLQLPAQRGPGWLRTVGLPGNKSSVWQTAQPWYVWLDGRPVALDAFVENDLDPLIAAAPDVVRQWAARFPRPTNPMALARWLRYFNVRATQAQPNRSTVAKLVTPN